jgi:ribonuclease R
MKKAAIYPYDMAQMLALGEHCSMTERRADDATRDVVAWLKCEYLYEHVGAQYQGVVSAVTSFGLFVELVDVYIEGLVHVSTLRSDYYHFDAATQRLVGEHSRSSYGLGDSMAVRLVRVNLDDRKIDLEPLDAGPEREPRKSRKARKRKHKKH